MKLQTRFLMIASAAFMALLGTGLTFLPQELLAHIAIEANQEIVLLMQILGALYIGFAALDWMSRGHHIGGIYARPLSIANLFAYLIAAIALLKAVVAAPVSVEVWVVTGIYSVFSIWFGLVVFTHPADSKHRG